MYKPINKSITFKLCFFSIYHEVGVPYVRHASDFSSRVISGADDMQDVNFDGDFLPLSDNNQQIAEIEEDLAASIIPCDIALSKKLADDKKKVIILNGALKNKKHFFKSIKFLKGDEDIANLDVALDVVERTRKLGKIKFISETPININPILILDVLLNDDSKNKTMEYLNSSIYSNYRSSDLPESSSIMQTIPNVEAMKESSHIIINENKPLLLANQKKNEKMVSSNYFLKCFK